MLHYLVSYETSKMTLYVKTHLFVHLSVALTMLTIVIPERVGTCHIIHLAMNGPIA